MSLSRRARSFSVRVLPSSKKSVVVPSDKPVAPSSDNQASDQRKRLFTEPMQCGRRKQSDWNRQITRLMEQKRNLLRGSTQLGIAVKKEKIMDDRIRELRKKLAECDGMRRNVHHTKFPFCPSGYVMEVYEMNDKQ